MVISTMGILLYAKVSSLYIVLWEWLCCCLQVSYIVYKHFDGSLHIWVLDPTCVKNFRPVPLTVFEIQEQEEEEEEAESKIGENGLFAISSMLVVLF